MINMNMIEEDKYIMRRTIIQITSVIMIIAASFVFVGSGCGVTGQCGTSIVGWVLLISSLLIYLIGSMIIDILMLLQKHTADEISNYLRESILNHRPAMVPNSAPPQPPVSDVEDIEIQVENIET